MGKYILSIFCLVLSFQTLAGSFSWSNDASGESIDLAPSRDIASRREMKGRKLTAVDPNSFRFKDHRGKKSLTILAFGDSGTGEVDQYNVGEQMYHECQKEKCDFALLMGDVIYPMGFNDSGKREISQEDLDQVNLKFERPYKEFGAFDFWMVPGNHDWYGDLQHAINYTKKSVRWKMPFNHYEIPWLPRWIRIYGLDTSRIERLDPDSGLVKEQMDAANNKYPASIGLVDGNEESFCGSGGWKILFGHHGIYTSGRHGKYDMVKPWRNLRFRRKKGQNRYMRKKLLPFIKSCGVQILAVGHDHHQEHIKAIDPKTKKLIFHQILQGAAGKFRGTEKVDHEEYETLVTSSMLGFSILKFTPEKLHIKYYGYPEGRPDAFKMYYEAIVEKKDFK